jgi:hypothetical protein
LKSNGLQIEDCAPSRNGDAETNSITVRDATIALRAVETDSGLEGARRRHETLRRRAV